MWSALAIVLLLLIPASYLTTNREWIGQWPAGEWTILVTGEGGIPIRGAVVRVTAFADEAREALTFLEKDPSDSEGRLILRNRMGRSRGGSGWYFLWLIPIGNPSGGKGPIVRVYAEGCETASISFETVVASKAPRRVAMKKH